MKIISAYAFAFLFLITQASAQDSAAAKLAEYWKQADLQPIEITKYVNEKNCSTSAQVFFGCYNAAAILVALTTEKTSLTLTTSPKRAWQTGVVQAFGTFEIRTIDPKLLPKNITVEEQQQSLADINKDRKDIAALFSNPANSKEVEAILAWALAKAPADKKSQYIAESVEKYFVYGVDAHAHIHTAPEYVDMTNPEAQNESFFGIGAVLQPGTPYTMIREPMKGSPAALAGLRPGDKIFAVDGVTVENLELDKVVEKIRGPENTSVTLTILRKNEKLEKKIVRGPVQTKNIETEILDAKNGEKVVYLSLRDFMEDNLCQKFVTAISTNLEAAQTSNLIIDLRSNGGGLMGEALCMAAAFYPDDGPLLGVWDLDQNTFVQRMSYSKSYGVVVAMAPGQRPSAMARVPNISALMKGKKVVVLTNAYSASASEIFAGIMQDSQLGFTVGERSFGKGTIQQPNDYVTESGTLLKMFRTVARFHLPTDRTNQISGIKADIEVFASPKPKPEDTFFMREEQLYSHAVVAAKNNYVTPADLITKSKECLSVSKPEVRFDAEVAEIGFSDYQKLVATELASCL